MIDYSIYYKSKPVESDGVKNLGCWDILISAYNNTDRVRIVYDSVRAKQKLWVIHSEYGFEKLDSSILSNSYVNESESESEFITVFFKSININPGNVNQKSICIDATGFLRPYLMFMILFLYKIGAKKIDVSIQRTIALHKERKNNVFSWCCTRSKDLSMDLEGL